MGIEPTRDRMNRLSTALKAVGRTSVPSASVRSYITPFEEGLLGACREIVACEVAAVAGLSKIGPVTWRDDDRDIVPARRFARDTIPNEVVGLRPFRPATRCSSGQSHSRPARAAPGVYVLRPLSLLFDRPASSAIGIASTSEP